MELELTTTIREHFDDLPKESLQSKLTHVAKDLSKIKITLIIIPETWKMKKKKSMKRHVPI